MRNNLLVVRAGDDSLHPHWLGKGEPRNFDLLVSYFGSTPKRYSKQCEIYHALPGPRWPAHHAIVSENIKFLQQYRRIGFACDDLEATPDTWNRTFDICDWYELDLAQPSVVGHTSWDITQPQPASLLRYTNYVETMCPVFSRRALEKVRDTFSQSVSGWGLDVLWSCLLPYPEYKIAILDNVQVVHTGPIRKGSLRPVLDALGIDPVTEMKAVLSRHGIEHFKMSEHARLLVSHGAENG